MLEGRDWFAVNGATVEELTRLLIVAPDNLPKRYLDLLTFSNGGEGPLAIQPYSLCLDPAMTVADAINSKNHGQAELEGFLIFGSNGGGEYLAFDTRHKAPWPVVSIDMVAGGNSATIIASDFDVFYDRIGVEAEAA